MPTPQPAPCWTVVRADSRMPGSAARLIHERYVSTIDPGAPRSLAAMLWADLNEFYRA